MKKKIILLPLLVMALTACDLSSLMGNNGGNNTSVCKDGEKLCDGNNVKKCENNEWKMYVCNAGCDAATNDCKDG